MVPQKSFKIQGPRLAKNAFPEISAWKNEIKVSQHVVALLLNLGVLKKNFRSLWEGGQLPTLPPASYQLSYGPAF